MSQINKPSSGSTPVPPTVPLQFNTQDGNAVPSANILIVNAYDTRENNLNGIETKGGLAAGDPPGTGSGNELDIYITNRLQGVVSTANSTPTPIITFTPTAVGTYAIEVRIAAYNTTSTLGAGYSLFGSIRWDGANSNLCGTVDKIVNEEGAMSSANVTMTVSGSNTLINAVGYATENINWSAVGLYTYIGA